MEMTILTLLIGIIGAVVAVFFFVGRVFMLELAKRMANEEDDLQQDGVMTEGFIAYHIPHLPFVVPSLAYNYQHEDKKYQGKQHVLKKDYNALKDGASVTIRYLSRKPEVATLVDCQKIVTARYYLLLANSYLYLAIIFVLVSALCFIKIFCNYL